MDAISQHWCEQAVAKTSAAMEDPPDDIQNDFNCGIGVDLQDSVAEGIQAQRDAKFVSRVTVDSIGAITVNDLMKSIVDCQSATERERSRKQAQRAISLAAKSVPCPPDLGTSSLDPNWRLHRTPHVVERYSWSLFGEGAPDRPESLPLRHTPASPIRPHPPPQNKAPFNARSPRYSTASQVCACVPRFSDLKWLCVCNNATVGDSTALGFRNASKVQPWARKVRFHCFLACVSTT